MRISFRICVLLHVCSSVTDGIHQLVYSLCAVGLPHVLLRKQQLDHK